jgi:hypothetical protein
LQLDAASTNTKRALPGVAKNLFGRRLKCLAEIAGGVRQLPELRSRNVSANRQDDKIGAAGLCEHCGYLDRAICARRAIGGNNDALHAQVPALPDIRQHAMKATFPPNVKDRLS